MNKYIFALFICFLPYFLLAQTYKGDIVGSVIDGKTLEPLPMVNVQVVELPTFGASTDASGNFIITGIPVGSYSLKATLIGYETIVQTNVVITTGRSTKMALKLFEQAISVSGVTVQANYFSRNNDIAPLSVNSYDRAEVKRQPGSVQDVQRVVQSLPGVASSNDNINELIVRGGAPFENLTVMEHMEIPSINHYPNEYNSAGPINMVNIDLVEDVQFSAGGFPVQYGDKMSSVMDITVREGDRTKGFSSNTGFNMAGFGTLMEGQFADGKGSWIFSARQSLLEIIDKIMGMSAISLTAIPKYYDAQTKIVYDLSPTQKLTLNGIYGDSRIYFKGVPKEANKKKAGIIDSTSLQNVDDHNKQYVLGLNLKSLWGKEGYSILSYYTVGTQYNVDVRENFTRRKYGSTGEVLTYDILNTRDVFNSHNDEAFHALKYDIFYQIHPQHDLTAGAQIQTTSHWWGKTTFSGGSMYYDLNKNGVKDGTDLVVISPDGNIPNSLDFGDASKMYTYASDKYHITPRLNLTFGLRYDYFTYSKQGQLSPRANIAYELIPITTIVSLSAGEYWQTQPLPNYSDTRNVGYNKNLENSKSQHVVLGLQHILDEGVKLSVEAYYKKFSNIAVGEEYVHSLVDTIWSDKNLAIGKRESYGLEFLLQKKQVTNYYGTVSVSLSKTTEEDPRIGKEGQTYPSSYDYPVIFTLIGGKVVKGVRSWLDETPFFIKYPSYILPVSDEMEISFRYRYQTGTPCTPYTFNPYVHYREGGGIKWSQGAWQYDRTHVNSDHYPDYSRLDIEWISRFYMQNWNINVYIALENVLDTKNVFYYEYRSDGTREAVYQFSFFPVGGIEIEF
jgi:outer membrane receptor for ferrienterochelin and colicin